MIKVKFLIDNSEWSKYKDFAQGAFDDFVTSNKLKDKRYKNGTRAVWFTKTAWKFGSYLISNLEFESIPIEVTGKGR